MGRFDHEVAQLSKARLYLLSLIIDTHSAVGQVGNGLPSFYDVLLALKKVGDGPLNGALCILGELGDMYGGLCGVQRP